MRNITTVFNKTMKMSDLIDADFQLLLLLMRLDIPLGFGEKNVETVCKQSGFDVDCFIFLVNFQSSKSIINVHSEFEKLPLAPFLQYLKKSHAYFLKDRLPNIRRKLEMVFDEEETDQKNVVLSFFDTYMAEVHDHMVYEDEVVFPYVNSLLDEACTERYSINIFEERHNDIDDKVNDLKRILLKYVSSKDQGLIVNILMELYLTQEELEAHTFIEDELIIPRVKRIEHRS